MATRDWPRIWLGPGDVPLPLGYPDWDGRWPEAVVAWHMGIAREEPRRYVPERTCRVVSDSRRISQTQVMTDKACSACGHLFGSEETRPVLPGLDETMTLDAADIPNYCPGAGRKSSGTRV